MTDSLSSSARTVLGVVGITILAFLFSLFLGFVFALLLIPLGYEPDSTFTLVGITIVSQLGFLILAYIYIRRRDLDIPLEIPSRSDLTYTGGGIVLTLITALGLSQILSYLDLGSQSSIEKIAETNPLFLLALAVLSLILIAPSEELLFRGAVQGRLRERFEAFPSIVTASLLFGSLHLLNYNGAIIPIILTTLVIVVIGGILGILYERTDNLVVPILVHSVYNFVILVPSYFAVV
ncbi:MAG: type II CAAX endopeptidase family protein [Candidatus Thermoplasmatota archaeon]